MVANDDLVQRIAILFTKEQHRCEETFSNAVGQMFP